MYIVGPDGRVSYHPRRGRALCYQANLYRISSLEATSQRLLSEQQTCRVEVQTLSMYSLAKLFERKLNYDLNPNNPKWDTDTVVSSLAELFGNPERSGWLAASLQAIQEASQEQTLKKDMFSALGCSIHRIRQGSSISVECSDEI